MVYIQKLMYFCNTQKNINMRRSFVILLMLCLLGNVFAQSNKCGIDTKALMKEEVDKGASTISFLAKMKPEYSTAMFEREGIVVGARAGNILTLCVPVDNLSSLERNPDIIQYSIAHRVGGITMDKTRADTHTDKVQSGEDVINGSSLNGSGVLIGITDWGFDYTHPNINGVKNKIIERAWDHYRKAGPAPEGFNYGTEIVGFEALRDALGDTSNLYNYGTHGTHVAGICAGYGADDKHRFRGQAPGAHLLLCSFGLNESDWLDGVAWMHNVAKESGKRLVVNSSWGMYSFSCLDGRSLLSQAIDNLSNEGVVFCTSAGNNGDVNFHISRNFDENPDTIRTMANYYNYATDAIGQCLIMWGEEGHDFSACFRMRSEDSTIWAIPMVSTENDTIIYDTLLCDTIRIPYRILVEHSNPYDNRPHIQMDVNKDLSLQLQLFIIAESGTVHAWNVANKTNHAGNEGAAFSPGGNQGFDSGDALFGVGEPGCASKTITVAAHHADTWSYSGDTFFPGVLASFSSNGPLISGVQKPEISAPGYQVNSSISYWTDGTYSPTAEKYAGGRTYIWSQMSGTSMSSPAVTGIVALVLQANPLLSTDEVREILFTTARNDSRTGDLHQNDSMSICWGWGKVDALEAVNKAIKKLSIEDAEKLQKPLLIYPNPTSSILFINTGCGEVVKVQIYNIEGECLLEKMIAYEGYVNINELVSGVYIIRVGNRMEKLVVK